MSGKELLKFGVPVMSKRLVTGTCGIEPWKVAPEKPPAPPQKIPDHLIRPPCRPEQKLGRNPPDCASGLKGYFCPSTRLKYKYPPFSENIDFVPSGKTECWWTRPRQCEVEDMDEALLVKN